MEDSMQEFLMNNILPNASRRKPMDIRELMAEPFFEALYQHYEEPFLGLFKYFSATSEKSSKVTGFHKSAGGVGDKPFDQGADEMSIDTRRNRKKALGNNQMTYPNFIHFATDFGLLTTGLTSLDIGDAYLSAGSSYSVAEFTPDFLPIDFQQFWNCIIRCCLLAFKTEDLPANQRVMAAFMSCWRYTQSILHNETYVTTGSGPNPRKQMIAIGGPQYKAFLLFSDRFTAQWARDGHVDYLDAEALERRNRQAKRHSPNMFTLDQDVSPGSEEVDTSNPILNVLVLEQSTRMENARVVLDMDMGDEHEDDETAYLGDDRIKLSQLRALLQAKPELALMLQECIEEAGLALSEDV
jgi:hypothetical protein